MAWHGQDRTLTVGDRTVVVPEVFGDNEELLRCYLALVREVRALEDPEPFELRQDDIEVLADLLDLDDADLEHRLARLLDVGAPEAAELRRRMLARRILVAAGTMTVGLIASVPLAAAGDVPQPSAPAVAATMSAGASITDIGVPLVIERDPPVVDEHVEIIDALVIERDLP
ncbi:MAG: hypothetical protein QOH64_2889 [Acidimicrobiaceae bacterium]